MLKSQFILSGLAVLMVVGLFALPKSMLKSDRKSGNTPVAEQTEQVLDPSQETHQGAGTQEQATELIRLKRRFFEMSDKKVKIGLADSLANLYASVQKPDSAAFFVEQIAGLENNQKNMLRTGDAYYEAWRFAAESQKANPMGEKVREYYEKYLAANPADLEVKSRLAMTYSTSGTPMQAIIGLRQVLEDDPKNQTALFYLGLLSMKSGQYDKAVERFKQVLIDHPEDTEAHLYLGISYKQLGDTEAAKKELLFVKDTEKDPAILQAVETYLKEIQ